MPRPKLMIKRTSVEIAKGTRTCAFSREKIKKGEVCIVLYEDSRDRYVYSGAVALKMITMARDRLSEIEAALKGGTALD